MKKEMEESLKKFISEAVKSKPFGKNLIILLYGKSGTGKTESSKLLGKCSGKEVFRIDLSAVSSKYIGETEKNLDELFGKADKTGAILFFDEADALFSKRTGVKDPHNRYANIEIKSLLEKIEDYEGLVVLASNLKYDIEYVFVKRKCYFIPV